MTGYQSKKAMAQDKLDDDDTQVYQRPWVGLTDEDIALIDWESLTTKKDCVRAIEAKLKERNAQE
jgi:hypothetical protein